MSKEFRPTVDSLSSAVDYLPDAIINLDLQYTILSWNKAAEKLYGFRKEDVLGKSARNILITRYPDIQKDYKWQEGSGKEVVQQKKDGTWMNVLSTISTVRDRSGKHIGYVAINTDITRQKKIEEELFTNQRRLKEAQKAGSMGIFDWDMIKGTVWWSPKQQELLGYKRGTVKGISADWLAHIHPMDRERIKKEFQESIKHKVPINTEYRVIDKKFGVRWIKGRARINYDLKGKPVRMVGVSYDVTRRKNTEIRLTIQNQILEITTQEANLSDVICNVLQIVCENLTLVGAALWEKDAQGMALRIRDFWRSPQFKRLTKFEKDSRHRAFVVGDSLPGKIWETRDSFWVHKDNPLLTRMSIQQSGIETIIAVPVFLKKEFIGVLECYSDLNLGKDEELLDLLTLIGFQIGRVIDLKKLEEKLNYYAILSENIADAVISTDSVFQIMSWNKGAEELYGWKADEVIDRNLLEILPTAFQKEKYGIQKMQTELENVGSWRGEVVQQTRDGHVLTVLASVVALYDDNKRYLGAVTANHDITERKKLEELLQLKAEISRLLSSSVDYEATLKSVAKICVPQFADWCSVEFLQEDNTVKMLTIVHEDVKKMKYAKELRVKNPIDMSLNVGLPTVLKYGKSEFYPQVKDEEHLKFIKKDRYTSLIIAPIVAHERTIGAIQFATAESKRRFTKSDFQTAEQIASRAGLAVENAILYDEVKKERARLDNLVSNVPGVVWEEWENPDVAIQRIDYVSGYVEKMLGYSVDEWLATPNFWLTIVHPEDREQAYNESVAIFKSGKRGVSRFRWLRKDGKAIWVEAQSFVIKDKKGQSVGTRGVTMDISERMEMEKRKDEFISIASHELKTPITSIKVFTHILNNSLTRKHDNESKKHLIRMEKQLDKLAQLVGDLLDVSKIQTGKLELRKELFSMQELVIETVENIQAVTPTHKILIKGEITHEVYGDKDRISQVLINLLTNAIKYSPNSKKIVISLRNEGERVRVGVRDYGIGIPQDQYTKIFDRFYRVNGESQRTFPGLGIGLYISNEIVLKHNGKMSVQSSLGKGSEFIFTIPLS